MSLSTFITALLLFITSVCAQVAQAQTAPAEPKARVWDYADYKIVPVRVHLLRDTVTTAAGTTLTNDDIVRIFKKANGIWHAAGVHLRVESIVSEKPEALGENEHKAEMPTDGLLALRPTDTRPVGMFHVYYIGAMSPNGIFMRRDGIFVKESARLKKVPGGIDEPLPRVSAHELGHGMGLPHRQDTTNLMASGTTGTSLNDAEIEIVRQTLSRTNWVETPEACLKAADTLLTDGKKEEALSRYHALLELPGDRDGRAALQAKIAAAAKIVVGGEGHGKGSQPDAKP
jgi:hypothetical protein